MSTIFTDALIDQMAALDEDFMPGTCQIIHPATAASSNRSEDGSPTEDASTGDTSVTTRCRVSPTNRGSERELDERLTGVQPFRIKVPRTVAVYEQDRILFDGTEFEVIVVGDPRTFKTGVSCICRKVV